MSDKNGTFRVELPLQLKGVLDELRDMTGVPRRRDAVVCSISNLVWILDKMKDGHRILADKEGKCIELDAPYLAKARSLGGADRKQDQSILLGDTM